ncbi:MAG TPA: LuxR C-terminal-related transcriptional regulator [Pseudonocardiaceae bacterium]|nr:LuxR C-terminal-related transcriptional regulator [Pseudonocardiaceae bacterium]
MRDALLERESELLVLERSLTELAAGRGGVVSVEAAAGLGKTTLLRHVRELATTAGFQVMSARGAELEQEFTFGVVRQLFEPALIRHAAARRNLFTGTAGSTASLFAADGPAVAGPQRAESVYLLLNGLYWLLVNLSELSPVVILVDDVQWVDPPSLRFLGFLARRVDSIAVTVVIAGRPGFAPDDELVEDILGANETTVLPLRDLSPAAVTDLVRQELGQGADPRFSAACHEVTSGNPLFVRELLRVLAGNGTPPTATMVASVRAAGPDAIRRHVSGRLRRRPSAEAIVARAVAVLGDDTSLALVAQHCDLPVETTAAAAEALTHNGIFDRDDPPAFVHAVVRDVVLSLVPSSERSAQHDRAALVLHAAGEPIARIASHVLRTTPAGNADRVSVLLAAADQARKQGSPGGAAVFLLRARNEPPPPGLRSEVSRLLGNCQGYQLALDEAEIHLREALALADSPPQEALCAYSLARFCNASGSAGEAADLLAHAINCLPAEVSADLPAELEAELIGVARSDLARRDDVLRHLASYRRRPNRSAAVTDAHLAVEAIFAGQPADNAITLAARALAGDRLRPDKSAIWVAVHALVVGDRLDQAETHLARALSTAVHKGLLFPLALVRSFLARVAYLHGDLDQAGEHVELGTAEVTGPNLALPVLHATEVHLLLEREQWSAADELLRQGPLAGGREPATVWELWLLEARTRLLVAQGKSRVALDQALACGRLYRRWGAEAMLDTTWRLQAAEAYRQLGEPGKGVGLVTEQLRLARAFGVPRHVGIALRCAALFADTVDEAIRLLREAVDLLQVSAARLELARTLGKLGTLLLDNGDRRGGLEAVGRTVELAVECHAGTMAERHGALLADTGTRPPRLVPSGVRAFTPAERQVAQLAANGLTNRQIAERLFLSEKTVEANLSRAYRKVGVKSRTQLTVRMAATDVSYEVG